jgi:hypothetical protein
VNFWGYWGTGKIFVIRKLFKIIRKNPKYKNQCIITLCASTFIACIDYASYGVLTWIPFHSVLKYIGHNRQPIPAISPLQREFAVVKNRTKIKENLLEDLHFFLHVSLQRKCPFLNTFGLPIFSFRRPGYVTRNGLNSNACLSIHSVAYRCRSKNFLHYNSNLDSISDILILYENSLQLRNLFFILFWATHYWSLTRYMIVRYVVGYGRENCLLFQCVVSILWILKRFGYAKCILLMYKLDCLQLIMCVIRKRYH